MSLKTLHITLVSAACLLATTLLDANPKQTEVLLRGVLDMGGRQTFSLSDPAGAANKWLEIGQRFRGYKLLEYDTEAKELKLESDAGEIVTVSMAGSSLTGTGGSPEARLTEATALMEMMRFEEMIDDTLEAQMAAMSKMMRQQMSQLSPDGKVDEELIEFQSRAMAEMFEEIDWEPIQAGMAKAYAEVFTEEELKGMSNFYTTPAGQASLEKMPEVQAKSMEVMMPAIMGASQNFQQKLMQFMQERKAKSAE